MDDENYAKLLLESSFKESNAFWIRNGGYVAAQGLLLGLVATDDPCARVVISVAFIGIGLAILHALVIVTSKYYNKIWLERCGSWVDDRVAEHPTKSSWTHMRKTLLEVDGLRFKPTDLTYGVPALFALAWSVLLYLSFSA